MDHAAWLNQDTGEDGQKAYQYFMRPDPDQREFVGDRMEEVDELTGRRAQYRMCKVGMVRGAAPENMKEAKVYIGFDGKPSLPHVRLDSAKPLQGWYQSRDGVPKGGRERPCMTDAILTEPYGGYCTVGCAFCYINSGFRGYRGTGLITVPTRYGEQISKQISRTRTLAAGYFSSFTDPFLPLEEIYHNTQEAAEAFSQEGLPIFFLSRMAYPDWAIDMLRRNKYSYAQKSINTPDALDWAKLSPGALPLENHMEEIRKLSEAGIYVSIQVNPILPGVVTHGDVVELMGMLGEAGADHAIVKFVEANHPWAQTMEDRVIHRFGERGQAFAALFTERQCGGQRTVIEEYRLEGHRLYQAAATEAGMTYATCYEYGRDPKSVTGWRSIGHDWLTADQCHGHRVPMFTRQHLDDPFREVEDCPPAGCLTCGEDNLDDPGEPRCGSDLFGSAKALRMTDLRQPVYQIQGG